VRLPIVYVTCPTTRSAIRPEHRVGVDLRGNNLLLNLRQQLLCFGQRHTQVGDITKTVRPADRQHIETPGVTINPWPNQTQHPFHR
jgi:hypothetical protein